MLTSLSVSTISDEKSVSQPQDKNSSEGSFSERVVRLNQEIRLNHIKLSEQPSKPKRNPSLSPQNNTPTRPNVEPKNDEAA